jgi:endoglucanase
MKKSNLFCIILALFYAQIFAQTAAFPFPNHTTYTTGTIKPNNFTQVQLDNQVKSFYTLWKAEYVKQHCTDNTKYYIDFSNNSNNDTAICVSEGQGYGMVIVAYMAGYDTNAKTIYDGLYKWAKSFPSNINASLMKWRQKDGCLSDSNDAAADGDLNIAYSLLLADKQWGSAGSINYLQEAKNIINNGIKAGLLNPSTNTIRMGDWVDASDANRYYGTRLSDYNSNHLRAFKNATSDVTWDNVINKGYSIVNTIQTNHSPNTGLLPDFTINTNTTPIPAYPGFLEGNNDGFYAYNACRTPWNLGLDYVLNGSASAKTAADKINVWIKNTTSGTVNNLQSGYKLDGTTYGENYRNLTFVAPFAVGAMVNSNHQVWLNDLWTYIVNAPLLNNQYFGDIIKMQCMIIISGNYWKPQSVALGVNDNNIENKFSSINIRPNPSKDICTLNFYIQDSSDAVLIMTNALGKKVYTKNYNALNEGENSIDIDLKKFSSGTYFCQINTGKTTITGRVIVN